MVTFPFGILGQVLYLIVSIPDPCCLSYVCCSHATVRVSRVSRTSNFSASMRACDCERIFGASVRQMVAMQISALAFGCIHEPTLDAPV